ncbi:hypothetical protein WA026_023462 [Henosepilachna vigintioctopunctata]|uniref:Uncharacterized protein n=1 Tax=Henosepilachna vigintioctopunctata TaxID=420089 RepID=A0AAW1VDX5_9CUCU
MIKKPFKQYGVTAECDIANRCGFSHLEDKDLAMKAIEDLNGSDFMGVKISVEKVGDFRGGPRNGYGGSRDLGSYGDGDRLRGGRYDRPPRDFGQGGGYGERGGGDGFGGGGDRRSFNNSFDGDRGGGRSFGKERGGFDERWGRAGFEHRRPPWTDRGNSGASGLGGFDRGGDSHSRRDNGLKAMGGGGYDRGHYNGGAKGYSGVGGGYGGGKDSGGFGGNDRWEVEVENGREKILNCTTKRSNIALPKIGLSKILTSFDLVGSKMYNELDKNVKKDENGQYDFQRKQEKVYHSLEEFLDD